LAARNVAINRVLVIRTGVTGIVLAGKINDPRSRIVPGLLVRSPDVLAKNAISLENIAFKPEKKRKNKKRIECIEKQKSRNKERRQKCLCLWVSLFFFYFLFIFFGLSGFWV